MKKCGLIICMATLGFLCSKTALKAAAAEATPWQTYLDKAPVQAEQFAADPLGTLVRLFAAEPVQLLRDTMQQYADVLLFLSLAAGLAFLLQDTADRALLELAAAGGCGVLLWQELDKLAAALCTRMAGWKSYLLGFLPVYSGVLAAGGEWNAGAAANGFLLTVLCFIAQAVTLWLQPLLRSYLAISMACGISSRKSLFEGCTLTGRLLRQAIGWAGKAFAALMSIQRVVTVQLDRSASRLGQLLTGSVPIVGQALSNAADAVLAGMQLLKSTLGIAALLSIGAEFAPLYLGLLIHLLFLSCCGWLAGIGGLEYCHKLLQCFAEAVRCMAAVTALFFYVVCGGHRTADADRGWLDAGISAGRGSILHGVHRGGAGQFFCWAKLGRPVHKSRSRVIYFSSPSCAAATAAGQGFDRFFREHSPGGPVCDAVGYIGNGYPDRDRDPVGGVLYRTVPPAVRA